MKKISASIVLVFFATIIVAQLPATLRITGTRFTFQVFKKWAAEYNKIHPDVYITIASGIPVDSADIVIASHILKPGDVKDGQTSIELAAYVQLPVVNSKRTDLATLSEKGFTDEAFRQIYFTDEPHRANDFKDSFIVYKRQKAACSSISFANHFGNEHKDIKGINVPGDDQDLLEAVKKDKNAISHNSLGIIYNVNTRKINDSIAIIPIDLNENGKIDANEKIYSTIDEVVAFVEKTKHPKIPVENIHVIFSKTINRATVINFLEWVITTGQQFNHEFGLLNLNAATIQQEQALLAKPTVLNSGISQLGPLKNATIAVNKN